MITYRGEILMSEDDLDYIGAVLRKLWLEGYIEQDGGYMRCYQQLRNLAAERRGAQDGLTFLSRIIDAFHIVWDDEEAMTFTANDDANLPDWGEDIDAEWGSICNLLWDLRDRSLDLLNALDPDWAGPDSSSWPRQGWTL